MTTDARPEPAIRASSTTSAYAPFGRVTWHSSCDVQCQRSVLVAEAPIGRYGA